MASASASKKILETKKTKEDVENKPKMNWSSLQLC